MQAALPLDEIHSLFAAVIKKVRKGRMQVFNDIGYANDIDLSGQCYFC